MELISIVNYVRFFYFTPSESNKQLKQTKTKESKLNKTNQLIGVIKKEYYQKLRRNFESSILMLRGFESIRPENIVEFRVETFVEQIRTIRYSMAQFKSIEGYLFHFVNSLINGFNFSEKKDGNINSSDFRSEELKKCLERYRLYDKYINFLKFIGDFSVFIDKFVHFFEKHRIFRFTEVDPYLSSYVHLFTSLRIRRYNFDEMPTKASLVDLFDIYYYRNILIEDVNILNDVNDFSFIENYFIVVQSTKKSYFNISDEFQPFNLSSHHRLYINVDKDSENHFYKVFNQCKMLDKIGITFENTDGMPNMKVLLKDAQVLDNITTLLLTTFKLNDNLEIYRSIRRNLPNLDTIELYSADSDKNSYVSAHNFQIYSYNAKIRFLSVSQVINYYDFDMSFINQVIVNFPFIEEIKINLLFALKNTNEQQFDDINNPYWIYTSEKIKRVAINIRFVDTPEKYPDIIKQYARSRYCIRYNDKFLRRLLLYFRFAQEIRLNLKGNIVNIENINDLDLYNFKEIYINTVKVSYDDLKNKKKGKKQFDANKKINLWRRC